MEDKRLYIMNEGKISKAVNQMAIPAIIGLLVLGIYNVVDTIFVSWLGSAATGATQVVMPITMLSSAIGLSFGIGGGTYISRLLGRGEGKAANRVASVIFFSTLLVGTGFIILTIIFLEPVLRFFGATDEIMGFAKEYGLYILLGNIFTMGNLSMNNLLRAEGSAKLSMVGMGIASLLNIIMDPIFIFVLDLGIAGAAMATSISKLVGFLILFSHFMRGRTILKLSLKNFRPSRKIYSEAGKVGIPTLIKQLLVSLSMGVLNQVSVKYGGTVLLASVGIVTKISMLPMYVTFGLGQGFQPVAGYNIGAGNKERVVASLRYALLINFVAAVICSTGMILFSYQILNLFKPSAEVLAFGVVGIRFSAAALILMSLSNTFTVFFQALGKGRESLLLSVARQGLFLIPIVLILPGSLGTVGILSAQFIADAMTLALTLLLIIPYFKGERFSLDIKAHTPILKTVA